MDIKSFFRQDRVKKLVTDRNAWFLVSGLLVGYALFGYFNDKILIFVGGGKYSGVGPQFAQGEQAELAALGYVSFAIAGLFFSATRLKFSARSQKLETSNGAVLGIVFILIGLVLVGFRTPS